MSYFSEQSLDMQTGSETGFTDAFEDELEESLPQETDRLPVQPVSALPVPPDDSVQEQELSQEAEEDPEEASADSGEPAGDETAAGKAQEEEARKRAAHEAEEEKRKAEWEEKQREKKKALQEQMDRVAAMSDDEALSASAQRICADVEKITRRNMKECVAEFIQTRCLEDSSLARLVMHPRKSMIHCFQYINRMAWEYIQDELKASGIEPGADNQGYSCDVPDDLCYQWGEDYFRDLDAKEDQEQEEKFVPKPYLGKPAAKTSKKKPEKKKAEQKPKPAPKKKDAGDGQMSLLELGMEKAG